MVILTKTILNIVNKLTRDLILEKLWNCCGIAVNVTYNYKNNHGGFNF